MPEYKIKAVKQQCVFALVAPLAKPGAFRVWRHHSGEDFLLFRHLLFISKKRAIH